MLLSHPYLRIRDDDQKRLQSKFDDKKIHFGFNVKSQNLEAWYDPKSSAPYKICTCDNVFHAVRLLTNQMKFEKMRAKDILAKMDADNDKVISDRDADIMHEVRHTLRDVATGKQTFTTSNTNVRKAI